MAFCGKCGKQLIDGAKFCFECGYPVVDKNKTSNANLDVDISARVLLKGARGECTSHEIRLPHLNKTVSVNVPNIISVGEILRLRGLGHTSPDGKKGDAYIHIEHIEYDSEQQSRKEPHRKVDYEGEIRKCPNCGDIIDAYETVCEACGFEIRGRKTTSRVHELEQKLELTYDQKKKDELIRNFYIPNTKEDIHEFFILALSNIKMGGEDANAWMVKLEQAYQKAELSFGGTQEFEHIKSLYKKTQWMNRKNSTVGFLSFFMRGTLSVILGICKCFKTGYAWTVLMVLVGMIITVIGFFNGSESGDPDSPYHMLALLGEIILIASWIPSAVYAESKKNSKGNNRK